MSTPRLAPNKEAIAREAAKVFCENHGLRERFIENDLTRAFQSVINKATTELREANDNLFNIKQRTVIENKQLKSHAAFRHTETMTAEEIDREQFRRNKARWRRPRLHFNRFALTANCLCECGLRFTTKGIAQHQKRCAAYQTKFSTLKP